MVSDWREITLSECAEFQEGYVNPSQKRGEYFGGSIKWLRAVDLNDGYVRKTTRTLTECGFNSAGKSALLFKPGTLAISKSGTIGRIGILCDYMCGNRAVINITVNEKVCSKRFVFFILKKNRSYLENLATGSVQKNLYTSVLGSLVFNMPTLSEQKAIANVLGALDDRIELNRRMNETLEAMAHALFKSWFVDFDPVIDNALSSGKKIPAALIEKAEARAGLGDKRKPLPEEIRTLFPDEFTYSEEMGWIPEGWCCGSILEKAKLLSGGTPKTSISEYWDGDIPWASAKDVSQCGESFLINSARHITSTGLAKSSTKIIPKFSTVFVARGATTGRLTMFGGDMAMNQTCYGLRADSEMHFYTYCHSKHFIDSIVNAGHGSIFTTITTTTFKASKVIHADEMIICNFEEFVSPIFQKVLSNQVKTRTLTKLRDTLLPKLLSGEIRIPDAEIMVEELAQ